MGLAPACSLASLSLSFCVLLFLFLGSTSHQKTHHTYSKIRQPTTHPLSIPYTSPHATSRPIKNSQSRPLPAMVFSIGSRNNCVTLPQMRQSHCRIEDGFRPLVENQGDPPASAGVGEGKAKRFPGVGHSPTKLRPSTTRICAAKAGKFTFGSKPTAKTGAHRNIHKRTFGNLLWIHIPPAGHGSILCPCTDMLPTHLYLKPPRGIWHIRNQSISTPSPTMNIPFFIQATSCCNLRT